MDNRCNKKAKTFPSAARTISTELPTPIKSNSIQLNQPVGRNCENNCKRSMGQVLKQLLARKSIQHSKFHSEFWLVTINRIIAVDLSIRKILSIYPCHSRQGRVGKLPID